MQIRVFYDGSCYVCRRIAKWIRQKDIHGDITLHDMANGAFVPEIWGMDNSVWDEPHGLVDDRIVRGPDLAREIFRALGYKRLTSLSRLPILHALFNFAIRFLSNNRYWLWRFI